MAAAYGRHVDADPPIIHQDIKSDNILLGEYQGQLVAKIADFGAVRIAYPFSLRCARERCSLFARCVSNRRVHVPQPHAAGARRHDVLARRAHRHGGQDQHLGVARVHTEAVTANENALIASNLSLNTR